jgi:hypothetical protein
MIKNVAAGIIYSETGSDNTGEKNENEWMQA